MVIDIARALADQQLLGAALGPIDTWSTWVAVLKAAFGLDLTAEELAVFSSVAGNRAPPDRRVREFWCVIGRRSGKSRIAAALAVFIALFTKHRLAKGERGMILVLASSVEQARVVFGYVRAFLIESPILAGEIGETTANEIRLKNGVVLAVHANSFRTIRGRTLLAAIFDEVSFWRDETSAQPDTETYTSVLPALATTNGMLIGISTPYRKLGLLYQKHRNCFGQDNPDVLVVQGATRTFNLSDDLSDAVIEAQRVADPIGASSEWDAEFRLDLSAFLDEATIEACIDYDRPLELPPRLEHLYQGFVDSSGGRHDAYAIGIGHGENGRFVIDTIRGHHAPFDPGAVTAEFASLAKQYRLHSVRGDYYSAGWVEGAWREQGLRYERSEKSKSEIYLEVLPVFTRGLASLPNHPQLRKELRLLERRTHVSGRDTVSHGRTGTDDFANATCGALAMVSGDGAALLWQRSSLPVVAAPSHPGLIYGVLTADKLGVRGSAVFFAASRVRGNPLCVLDCELAPLTPTLLHRVMQQLAELSAAHAAPFKPALFTSSDYLAAELARLNCHAQPVELIAKDPVLALSAAGHIASGRVQLCESVIEKPYPLSFVHGGGAQDDDPLRLSFLIGCAVGLDAGRAAA
jgi:hypothetical protein